MPCISLIKKHERIMRPNRVRRGYKVPKQLTVRAWVAGFIDGEGYICVHKREAHRCISIEVVVGNTVKEPIYYLQEIFGGHVQELNPSKYNPRCKVNWRWTAPANVARVVLKSSLPYFKVKKQQAELALKLLNLKNYQWTEERYQQELEILNQIRILNSKQITPMED